jgi:hypothetical protein
LSLLSGISLLEFNLICSVPFLCPYIYFYFKYHLLQQPVDNINGPKRSYEPSLLVYGKHFIPGEEQTNPDHVSYLNGDARMLEQRVQSPWGFGKGAGNP